MNRPCLNCQKRHLGCHSTCKEYKAFKEQLESIHEKKKEEFAAIDYLVAKDGAYGRMAKRRGVMRIG